MNFALANEFVIFTFKLLQFTVATVRRVELTLQILDIDRLRCEFCGVCIQINIFFLQT